MGKEPDEIQRFSELEEIEEQEKIDLDERQVHRLLMVESRTFTLSLLLARDWLTAFMILSLVSGSTESPIMDSRSGDSGLHSRKMRPW